MSMKKPGWIKTDDEANDFLEFMRTRVEINGPYDIRFIKGEDKIAFANEMYREAYEWVSSKEESQFRSDRSVTVNWDD